MYGFAQVDPVLRAGWSQSRSRGGWRAAVLEREREREREREGEVGPDLEKTGPQGPKQK